MHIVQAVGTNAVTVMVNGELATDDMFTNFAGDGINGMPNLVGAGSTLSALTAPYVGTTMATDIYIG